MTDTRHPDIEIYVKDRTLDAILEWLNSYSHTPGSVTSKGLIHELEITFPEGPVGVMIHEKVAGKAWVSVWFKDNLTPWTKDLDCALAASTEMATQVRCIAAGWDDGDDPDEFWKVESGTQEKIQWRC
jgi:hypothetical protein